MTLKNTILLEVDYNIQSAHFNHFKNEKYSIICCTTSIETNQILKQIRTQREVPPWTEILNEETIEVYDKNSWNN